MNLNRRAVLIAGLAATAAGLAAGTAAATAGASAAHTGTLPPPPLDGELRFDEASRAAACG